jgi:hypothetical protein
VFGDDRLCTHFSTEQDFYHSVRRGALLSSHFSSTASLSSPGEEVAHNYMVCGVYLQGRALKLHLQAQQGVTSVSTTFTSETEDLACFAVTAPPATMEDIDFTATPLL